MIPQAPRKPVEDSGRGQPHSRKLRIFMGASRLRQVPGVRLSSAAFPCSDNGTTPHVSRFTFHVSRFTPRTFVISSAFTLMEMLLALAISAIVIAGIGGVFYSAVRLPERTAAALEEAARLRHALAFIRR